MFKFLVLFFVFLTSPIFANYTMQDFEVYAGWRRDELNWNTRHLRSENSPGFANSSIHFKDINSYTVGAEGRWVGSAFYIRYSGEYGFTEKGRARENFFITSPLLLFPIEVETSNPIKRQSEVYDFNVACGYPFDFLECRLSFVPLVGFSFHRQHLRVKDHRDHSSSGHDYSSFFYYNSSSEFYLSPYNPFIADFSSDPFGSSSDPNIARELGLRNPHRTENYRFTWYGLYLGGDIFFALDPDWTLFSEIEFHFLDHLHRKRKTWTGVNFVDHHHNKSSAFGFNILVGSTYYIGQSWYATLRLNYSWWKSNKKNDTLEWKKVGAQIGIGTYF